MDTSTASAHMDNLFELERQLQETYDWVQGVKDPTFGAIKMRVSKHLMQDLNYLKMMTGNATVLAAISGGTHQPTQADLTKGPKMIMGKPVGTAQPVTKEDLTPSKAKLDSFKAQVKDLAAAFPSLRDSDLLAILGKPGGIALIKGVAKIARVPNYDTIDDTEIDVALFADIRAGLKEKAKADRLLADTDAALAQDNVKMNSDDEGDETPAPKKSAPKKSATAKPVAKKKPSADDYE